MTFRMDKLLVPLKPLGIFSLAALLLGNKYVSSLTAYVSLWFGLVVYFSVQLSK